MTKIDLGVNKINLCHLSKKIKYLAKSEFYHRVFDMHVYIYIYIFN